MADTPSGGAGPVVLCHVEHGVATVTLNRPERMNAWTQEMEDRYFATLDDLEADPDVRAIVVTGAGRGFCPGLDMEDLAGASQGRSPRDAQRTMLHALGIMKPMVAAINGACAGIGLVQALACDVRFAAAGARMTTSFARRGLVAEFGAPWFLERIVGHANALDLLLSARTIDAEEARAPRARELGRRARATSSRRRPSTQPTSPRTAHRSPWPRSSSRSTTTGTGARSPPRRTGGASSRSRTARRDFREGVASYVERRPPRFGPYTGATDRPDRSD